eukprot:2760716-Pleurochrysis_carterae.AAC.4
MDKALSPYVKGGGAKRCARRAHSPSLAACSACESVRRGAGHFRLLLRCACTASRRAARLAGSRRSAHSADRVSRASALPNRTEAKHRPVHAVHACRTRVRPLLAGDDAGYADGAQRHPFLYPAVLCAFGAPALVVDLSDCSRVRLVTDRRAGLVRSCRDGWMKGSGGTQLSTAIAPARHGDF